MTKSFLSRAIAFALSSGRVMSCLILALVGSLNALAQQRELEEIVVTTERREASEAVTAISMEVLTADDLSADDIKDVIDLQNAVPGVQFNQNGLYVQANIRGVGNPSTGGPGEQVGAPVMFDGSTSGEAVAINSGLFDVGDVQVLRGPQGTFIGQSAVAGAVLINSARPNFDGLNGRVETVMAEYNRRKLTGAVNLPISDKFAARVAFLTEERDSFFTNVSGNFTTATEDFSPGDVTDDAFRLSLLWERNENLSLYAKIEFSSLKWVAYPTQPNPRPYTGLRDHDNDPSTDPIPVTSYSYHAPGPEPGTGTVELLDHDGNPFTPPLDFVVGGTPGPGGVQYDPPDVWTLNSPFQQFHREENRRLLVELNHTFDNGITFRSKSSAVEPIWEWARNGDDGNSAVYRDPVAFNFDGFRTWNQEFNLISPEGQTLEWLVGLYRDDRYNPLRVISPLANTTGPFGTPCGWQYNGDWRPCPTTGDITNNLYLMIGANSTVVHTAAYGQLSWHVSDELELTLGARLNNDEGTGRTIVALVAHPDGPWAGTPFPTPGPYEPCTGVLGARGFQCPIGVIDNFDHPAATANAIPSDEEDTTTYKVGLNWEPSDGQFFYAFYARGYKAAQPTEPLEPVVRSEIVDDYEFGWKGTVLDGNLYAELGAYWMDYENMQMSALVPGPVTSSGGAQNLGDSEIKGIEGSVRAFIGNLGLNASFGYSDSELGEITVINEVALPFALSPGQQAPGDTNLGCTGANCFDYSPYYITVSGGRNLFSPELTYTLGLDYQFTMGSGATLTPRISFSHADEAVTSILEYPGDRYFHSEERDIVNFSLTYEKNDWSVQVFATNVTDEVFIEGSTVDGAGNGVTYGDPQVIGVRVGMDF